MQPTIRDEVLRLLQTASVERDLSQRLRVLQQVSDLLLHADTPTGVVASSIDYFCNLRHERQTSLRRYAVYFVGKVIYCKPTLALKCLPTVACLMDDGDGVVREQAAKAAIVLHGRAMWLLALEPDPTAFQAHSEHLQKIACAMRVFLQTGCPEQPGLFELASHWAKTVVLSQTSSPLVVEARVPAELRGVCSLQDFPEKVTQYLDLGRLRQQAEELFALVCNLLENPPKGIWRYNHLRCLLSCTSTILRQRPGFFNSAMACWKRLVQTVGASVGPESGNSTLSKVASEVKRLILSETRWLLSSNLIADRRADVAELLEFIGFTGSLDQLLSQSKYQQVCSVLGKEAADRTAEPRAKKARVADFRRVWSSSGEKNAGLADDQAFDGDALYAGEAETACRRFEDYFGLPSQREPVGHVPGPALLASRVPSQAELARIALTSLSSLSFKRSLLRDRAHERVVAFDDAPVRGPTDTKASEVKPGVEASDLELFLSAEPTKADNKAFAEDDIRDPRSLLSWQSKAPALPTTGDAEDHSTKDDCFDKVDATLARLDNVNQDDLQVQLFEEIIFSNRRMEKSPFCASLSAEQAAKFGRTSSQILLHIAMGGGNKNQNPNLQRQMCKSFLLDAFEDLKTALGQVGSIEGKDVQAEKGNEQASAAAMQKMVGLFYAKFSADVARWQDVNQTPQGAEAIMTTTPVREILETARNTDRHRMIFSYSELFEMFIAEFERLHLPKKEFRTFLNELPVVPSSAFTMLEAQCLVAGTRKMALLTVLSLIECKPSCRWQCLRLLFRLAYSGGDDSSIRFDTIRLVINKIYSPGPHPPMRWQLAHLNDSEASPLLDPGSDNGGLSWFLPEDEFLPLSQLRGRCVEDVSTMMLRSMAPKTSTFAYGVRVPPKVNQLSAELLKSIVCAPNDRVWLYLALCIKRPLLLHELVETFTKCDQDMKEHLINSIEEALKYIPASEKELLVMVQKATPETERLMIKVLHILVQTSEGKDPLSKEYGEAVTRLYGITQNPRLLVPVFDLLDRKKLLDFLPAVLELDVEDVKTAFRQLIRSKTPPLSVSELLTELHHMNNPTENIVPVKASMQALNVVFGMRVEFDEKVYGIVVQALVEEAGPLPTLFMRTVIQVVKEVPRLCDFIVMQILPRLVRPEVWGDDNMWRGFMIVLQHTFASQSGGAARVLAMMPMSQLEDTLVRHPNWKAHLRDYVARQPVGAVPAHVRQLLQ